jgi:hypothetical protein
MTKNFRILSCLILITLFSKFSYASSVVNLEVKSFDGSTIFIFYHDRNQKINLALRGKIVQATASNAILNMQVLNPQPFSKVASYPKLSKDGKSITFAVKDDFRSQVVINGEKLVALKLRNIDEPEEKKNKPEKDEQKPEVPKDQKLEAEKALEQGGEHLLPIKYSFVKGAPSITFDLADKTSSMAAFFRGKYLWVVFDKQKKFIFANNKILHDFSALESGDATILRFKVDGYKHAKTTKKDTKWTITLLKTPNKDEKNALEVVNNNPEILEIKGNFADNKVVEFHDPDIGDLLKVVLLESPSVRVDNLKESIDYNLLPSVQGIAVAMSSDEVSLDKLQEGIKIISKHKLPSSEDKGIIPHVNIDLNAIGSFLPLLDKKLDILNYNETKARLFQEASMAEGGKEIFAKNYELFRFYFVNKMYTEALAALMVAKKLAPNEYENDFKAKFLTAVTMTITGRYSEAKNLYVELQKGLDASPNEVNLWANYNEFLLGNNPVYDINLLANLNKSVNLYSENLYWPIVLTELELSLANGDMKQVEAIFKEIRKPEDPKGVFANSLKLYKANYYKRKNQANLAMQFFKDLAAQDDDVFNKVRAEIDLVKLQLSQKEITESDAAKKLESVRYAWRGDALEYSLLIQLASFYRDSKDNMNALRTYRYIKETFSNKINDFYITSEMVKIFNAVFLKGGAAEEMDDFRAVALFYEFRELNPIGEQGDDVILSIARRLTKLDLLTNAADLLRHQVRYRLTGEKRVLNADHLAIILLMDKKPAEAIRVLDETDKDNVKYKEHEYRIRLKVQALVDLGKYAEALDNLKDDMTVDAATLRREIYFRSENWNDYIAAVEPEVGRILSGHMNSEQMQDIVRLSTAYYMTGNHQAIENLSAMIGDDADRQALKNTVDLLKVSGAPVDYKNLDQSLNVDQMRILLDKYKNQLFNQAS